MVEELIKKLQTRIVGNRNILRFSLSSMIEKAIKDSKINDSHKFLQILFNTTLSENIEIHKRINEGESFMSIMSDIENKKKTI